MSFLRVSKGWGYIYFHRFRDWNLRVIADQRIKVAALLILDMMYLRYGMRAS